jgi:hypothetical protein
MGIMLNDLRSFFARNNGNNKIFNLVFMAAWKKQVWQITKKCQVHMTLTVVTSEKKAIDGKEQSHTLS